MSEHESEQDESDSVGLEGLADKLKAVCELVERRRHQVSQREAVLREAVLSLLRPVSPDQPERSDPSPGSVPPPASRLAGLRAQSAWQRVVGARWLVATDLINETSSEVPYPCLLLSCSPDEPLAYESRLVPLPFELGQPRLDQRPAGGLPPGQTVRTIAVVDIPAAAASDGCRLSLTLSSPPGQLQLDNDVGFYQLPAGDVTLTADQLLARQGALFDQTGGVSEADVQALWSLSGRPLRLRLRTRRLLSLQAGRDRLLQAGFVPAQQAVTRTDHEHPLFGCLVLLEEPLDSAAQRSAPVDAAEHSLDVTLWTREERQLPLLLHQFRQLFGPDCQLSSARQLHSAEQLRHALLTQLEFIEARIGGSRSGDGGGGGTERRALRLGDVHVPLAEYTPWRERLTELEEVTAACALDLVEPEEAILRQCEERGS